MNAVGDMTPRPLSFERLAELELEDLLDSLAPDFDPVRRQAIRTAVARKYRKLRELRAELELLETYDRRRSIAGYDYGSGQRGRELRRYRDEIRRIEDELDLPPIGSLNSARPTRQDKAAAFRRILAPKLARVEQEGYRRGSRPTEITRRILANMARVHVWAGAE